MIVLPVFSRLRRINRDSSLIFLQGSAILTLKMQIVRSFHRWNRVAITDREQALSVYRHHAMRAMREERWTAASIFFDRMLEVDPRNTEALLMKGLLAEHCASDPTAALECYRKVVHLCGPGDGHPHARRAREAIGRLVRRWA